MTEVKQQKQYRLGWYGTSYSHNHACMHSFSSTIQLPAIHANIFTLPLRGELTYAYSYSYCNTYQARSPPTTMA